MGTLRSGDGSFFCIFHALSFELNFFFDWRFPLKAYPDRAIMDATVRESLLCSLPFLGEFYQVNGVYIRDSRTDTLVKIGCAQF